MTIIQGLGKLRPLVARIEVLPNQMAEFVVLMGFEEDLRFVSEFMMDRFNSSRMIVGAFSERTEHLALVQVGIKAPRHFAVKRIGATVTFPTPQVSARGCLNRAIEIVV